MLYSSELEKLKSNIDCFDLVKRAIKIGECAATISACYYRFALLCYDALSYVCPTYPIL